MKLSVVIPVHNCWSLTEQCLHTLAQHAPSVCISENAWQIIVVDNGSTDATAASLKSLGLRLFGGGFMRIRWEQNRNFGPACNEGARQASGELLFFLNNDTLVSPGWLEPLLDAMEASRVGACGPVLTYPGEGFMEGRVQHAGVVFEPQYYARHVYEYFPAGHPVVQKERNFQALTAAALCIPKTIFFELGGFFPEYVNGGEDVDLGLGIAVSGRRQTVAGASRIAHLASQTPGRHDHEAANAALLKERRLRYIRPDFHSFLAQDGYEARLTPGLAVYAALPERRARILDRRLEKGLDMPECMEMLRKEPLWMSGYDWLATAAATAGDAELASQCCFLAAKLHPVAERFAALEAAAQQAGHEEYVRFSAAMRQKLANDVARRSMREEARSLASFHEQAGNESLAGLYRRWLAKRGV